MVKSGVLWSSCRTPCLAAAMLALGVTGAQAGLNLSWDDCGAAGSAAKVFACDTDAGDHRVVASFVVPHGLPPFLFAEATLALRFDGSAPPSWWSFKAGECRDGFLVASTNPVGITGCTPPGGQLLLKGGLRRTAGELSWSWQVGGDAWPTAPGTEVFLFKILISNHRTIEPGACPGCALGVEFRFVELALWGAPGDPVTILTAPGARNAIVWNGGLTSATNRTWGAIKALYRNSR